MTKTGIGTTPGLMARSSSRSTAVSMGLATVFLTFFLAGVLGPIDEGGKGQSNLRTIGQTQHQQPDAAAILYGDKTEATFTDIFVDSGEKEGFFEVWVDAMFVCKQGMHHGVRSNICDQSGNSLNQSRSSLKEVLLLVLFNGHRLLNVNGVRPVVHSAKDRVKHFDSHLAGHVSMSRQNNKPTVTVQLTFPRIDAEAHIFSIKLKPSSKKLDGKIYPIECPVSQEMHKMDLWYDDNLPVDEVFLQDDVHPIRPGPENHYVEQLKQYREMYGGHALRSTPQPTENCPSSSLSEQSSFTSLPKCHRKGDILVADIFDTSLWRSTGSYINTIKLIPTVVRMNISQFLEEQEAIVVRCVDKLKPYNTWAFNKLPPQSAKIVYTNDIFSTKVANRARALLLSMVPSTIPKLNIVVISIDSLSRSAFYSGMPRTQAVLRHIENIGRGHVYDFLTHRSVGRSSKGNIPAYMAGSGSLSSNHRYIFDRARDFGYASLMSAEECSFAQNSVARLMANFPGGFGSKLNAEQKDIVLSQIKKSADHTSLTNSFCNIEKIYRDIADRWWDMSAQLCFAGKYMHEHVLEYVGRFLDSKGYAANNVPLFALMHLNFAHESTMRRLRTGDKGIARFIQKYAAREVQNNKHPTAIMLISDHGIGYGKSYFSQSRRAKEDYLAPLFMMTLPEAYIKHQPQIDKALRRNTRRLTSHFDVFKTLMDLMGGASRKAHKERGDSLLSPLPEKRTCKKIGIPSYGCPCMNWKTVYIDKNHLTKEIYDLGNKMSGLLAKALNEELNRHVEENGISTKQCFAWKSGSSNPFDAAITTLKYTNDKATASVKLHTDAAEKFGDQIFDLHLSFIGSKRSQKLNRLADLDKFIDIGRMKISSWHQISKYGMYEKCAPEGVGANICVCG